MNVRLAHFSLALIAVAFAAQARDIHYGAVKHPDLLDCDQLQWHGQNDEADACYRLLLGKDVPPAIHAEAAWALGDLQLANRLFRDAAALQPDDASIRVRWGDLFSETHQERWTLIPAMRSRSLVLQEFLWADLMMKPIPTLSPC